MIYDFDQLMTQVNNSEAELSESMDMDSVEQVPIAGRVTIKGEKVYLDLLAFEYDEDDKVLYLNLGMKR